MGRLDCTHRTDAWPAFRSRAGMGLAQIAVEYADASVADAGRWPQGRSTARNNRPFPPAGRRHSPLNFCESRPAFAVRRTIVMSEPVAAVPIAKVYGQPVHEVPHDLYIPPDALEVFLEQFEGPLDLLLYLIRKENINVLDIPMARLTAAVPGVRRDDAHPLARAGGGVPADGGDADRDQVAHAAAAAGAERARGGSAGGTGAAPDGIRADEARGPAAERVAAGRARFLAGAGVVRARRLPSACRM